MTRRPAPAKINLALVVGPRRNDGRHDVTTILQRVDLTDRVALRRAGSLRVTGYRQDTLVRAALERLAAASGVEPGWEARIWKHIPVSAGLGGGSSDAATALRLANATLDRPLAPDALRRLAGELGADVPFFLADGPQLGEADGTRLTALALPQDYWVLLVLPHGERKSSTAAVYEDFDARGAECGYEARRRQLLEVLERIRRTRDLAALPPNDLAASAVGDELRELGAFRADVSGAGPAVYGLFEHHAAAVAAQEALRGHGQSWLTVPAWYG